MGGRLSKWEGARVSGRAREEVGGRASTSVLRSRKCSSSSVLHTLHVGLQPTGFGPLEPMRLRFAIRAVIAWRPGMKGYSGVLTGTYGYSRVLTGTHGYSWVLAGTHGYLFSRRFVSVSFIARLSSSSCAIRSRSCSQANGAPSTPVSTQRAPCEYSQAYSHTACPV